MWSEWLVDARQASLSISVTNDLLWFSHKTGYGVCTEWCEKKSNEQQFWQEGYCNSNKQFFTSIMSKKPSLNAQHVEPWGYNSKRPHLAPVSQGQESEGAVHTGDSMFLFSTTLCVTVAREIDSYWNTQTSPFVENIERLAICTYSCMKSIHK